MTIREKIKKAMNDLMQKNVECNYFIIAKFQGSNTETMLLKKNILALDAYMFTYELHKEANCDINCYMAPNEVKAVDPVFQIINGKMILSGTEI